jgi:hypothetical protein
MTFTGTRTALGAVPDGAAAFAGLSDPQKRSAQTLR